MNLIKGLIIVLILNLIGCASKQSVLQSSLSESVIQANNPMAKAPDIALNPEDAFFPLRSDPSDGKVKPSYQYDLCVKKFIVCLKFEKRTVFFEDLTWFYQNSFGLKKIPGIK